MSENKKDKAKETEDRRSYGLLGTLFDAVSIFVTSVTLLAIVFTFGLRMVGVDGPSMENTLHTGEWLLVTPYYEKTPSYGDIVICTKKTAARGAIVKRVIAVAGDEVNITPADEIYVNGKKLDEPYAQVYGTGLRGDRSYPLTVPEGCVMLLGDNRDVSFDSRYSAIGFIEYEHLLGKAQLRVSRDYDIYKTFPKD